MNSIISKIKSSIDIKTKPRNLKIFEFTKIINPEYLFVGDNVVIDDFCLIYAKAEAPVRTGSWVHLVNFSSYTGGPITIGNFIAVSGGARLLAGSDHYGDGALMNSPIPEKYRNTNREGCILQDFCFIGANSCVYPGVTIGEGAVVGAGSIVRTDLEPWGIYVMKNEKMVKIKDRNEEKTYENARKLMKEFKNVRLLKNPL